MFDQIYKTWKERLSGLPDLQLPTDYPRPLPLQVIESDMTIQLPDDLCMSLLRFITTQENAPTPFAVLLSAFLVLIHRYSNESDVVLGSSGTSQNTCVLRINVQDTFTFLDLLLTVQKAEKEALENEIPFDDLINRLAEDQFPNLASLTRIRFFDFVHDSKNVQTSTASDWTIVISQSPTAKRLLPIQIKCI